MDRLFSMKCQKHIMGNGQFLQQMTLENWESMWNSEAATLLYSVKKNKLKMGESLKE